MFLHIICVRIYKFFLLCENFSSYGVLSGLENSQLLREQGLIENVVEIIGALYFFPAVNSTAIGQPYNKVCGIRELYESTVPWWYTWYSM